jgi:hypothetical protein
MAGCNGLLPDCEKSRLGELGGGLGPTPYGTARVTDFGWLDGMPAPG